MMNALKELLRMPADPGAGMSVGELVMRTPLGQLEETVKALMGSRPHAEVRQAMVERIARAPLADFEMLKAIYLKYCADTEH